MSWPEKQKNLLFGNIASFVAAVHLYLLLGYSFSKSYVTAKQIIRFPVLIIF